MILITRLPMGLLLQKDDAELIIADGAIPQALAPTIAALIDCTRSAGRARTEGYEAGLIVGHANGVRETEARYRHTEDVIEALGVIGVLASAA